MVLFLWIRDGIGWPREFVFVFLGSAHWPKSRKHAASPHGFEDFSLCQLWIHRYHCRLLCVLCTTCCRLRITRPFLLIRRCVRKVPKLFKQYILVLDVGYAMFGPLLHVPPWLNSRKSTVYVWVYACDPCPKWFCVQYWMNEVESSIICGHKYILAHNSLQQQCHIVFRAVVSCASI